jgi:hypothetical protein
MYGISREKDGKSERQRYRKSADRKIRKDEQTGRQIIANKQHLVSEFSLSLSLSLSLSISLSLSEVQRARQLTCRGACLRRVSVNKQFNK